MKNHAASAPLSTAFLPPSSPLVTHPNRRRRPATCNCATSASAPLVPRSKSAACSFTPFNRVAHHRAIARFPIRERVRRQRGVHASSSGDLDEREDIERVPLERIEINEPNTTPSEISMRTASTAGFALADAEVHSFEKLEDDETLFQTGGTYAILNDSNQFVYMGYTKNIANKLRFHQQLQYNQCIQFKVYTPLLPPELISPDLLENVLEYWIQEIGYVPKGNTVDRLLWEQKPSDRKINNNNNTSNNMNNKFENNIDDNNDNIPIRERSTEKRTSRRKTTNNYYSNDPFADMYRTRNASSASTQNDPSATNTTARNASSSWDASSDDYVQVDVDPFDPFSASSRNKTTTRSSWNDLDLDDTSSKEDWYPIFIIMGFGGLVWLFGLLSNALPAATPSLGM